MPVHKWFVFGIAHLNEQSCAGFIGYIQSRTVDQQIVEENDVTGLCWDRRCILNRVAWQMPVFANRF